MADDGNGGLRGSVSSFWVLESVLGGVSSSGCVVIIEVILHRLSIWFRNFVPIASSMSMPLRSDDVINETKA
jgi:hypothetical protein